MRVETRDSRALGKFLKNRGRWSSGVRAGRRKELNKNKNFYQLNINYMMLVSYMGHGQVGALGKCPSCPGPGSGLSRSCRNFTIPVPMCSSCSGDQLCLLSVGI